MSNCTVSLIDELRQRLGLPSIDELRARVGLDTTEQVRQQVAAAENGTFTDDPEVRALYQRAAIDSSRAKLRQMLEDTPRGRIAMLEVYAGAIRRVIADEVVRCGGVPEPGSCSEKLVRDEAAALAGTEAEIEELKRTRDLATERGLMVRGMMVLR